MYKVLTLIILVVIGAASALPTQIDIDLCPECINEVGVLINVLLNLILDEGIVQSCEALCGAVANKTGSVILGDLCNVACTAVGIDEFVRLIINADIDPIYYCQLVDLCPINDHGDAKFTNFGVLPKSAPQGTTFVLDCSFMSMNGTGMGTTNFDIVDPKNETMGDIFWFEAKKPGTYPEKIGVRTYFISTCDPSKGACDDFPVGTYNVTAQVCNGMCGSHHPHTSVYDAGKTSFVVTKKQ